jgi:hypothetical protein
MITAIIKSTIKGYNLKDLQQSEHALESLPMIFYYMVQGDEK